MSLQWFQWLGHCVNLCLFLKVENKHCIGNYFSSLCRVFSLKKRHKMCDYPYTQCSKGWRGCRFWWGLWVPSVGALLPNVFETSLVLITELMLSSDIFLIIIVPVRSCTRTKCFNQCLKSRSDGFTQCFLTAKSDQHSCMLAVNWALPCKRVRRYLCPRRMRVTERQQQEMKCKQNS